jgi:hypothetical protein
MVKSNMDEAAFKVWLDAHGDEVVKKYGVELFSDESWMKTGILDSHGGTGSETVPDENEDILSVEKKTPPEKPILPGELGPEDKDRIPPPLSFKEKKALKKKRWWSRKGKDKKGKSGGFQKDGGATGLASSF